MSSSIGPAVSNAISIITAAIPQKISEGATQVVFGDIPKYVAPVTLQIIEVTGDQQPGEMGPSYRREETYSIVCEIVVWAGDQDYVQRFDDCMLIFNKVAIAIGNNPWLSTSGINDSTAAVRYAEVGNMSIIPHATPEGKSLCSLQFHIRCSQRVDSLD